MVSVISRQGVTFIYRHEGNPLKAYLCPAGVATIGPGLTMGSKVFAAYWMRTRGHALRIGDTIGEQEAFDLFTKVVNEEYGASVKAKANPKQEWEFDAATSMTYNCGLGALDWRWAKALARGSVSEAAALLSVTATTANGRRLEGLVKRRKEEARLLEHGDYGSAIPDVNSWESVSVDAIREYQYQLKVLSYYTGEVDGIKGDLTTRAVRKFQFDHDLTVDGRVGPATRATLLRELDARTANGTSAGSGAAAGGGAVVHDAAVDPGFDWFSFAQVAASVVIVAGLVSFGFYLYRNRGRIFGTGRVPS